MAYIILTPLTCTPSGFPVEALLDGDQHPPLLVQLLLVGGELHCQFQSNLLIVPAHHQLALDPVHLCMQSEDLTLSRDGDVGIQ